MKKLTSDTFFSTFIGEYVAILAEYENSDSTKLPVEILGYLLDMDQDYYFIGKENPIEIDAVVSKRKVCYIEIVKEKDLATEVLEKMEVPENDEETN